MKKQSSLSAAALHFLTGGATTHLVQNVATRTGLRNKGVAKSIADNFASGIKGVHDTSLKAKVMSGVRGTLAPDLEIMHHEAWNAGNRIAPLYNKMHPRAKVGLRMLAEGKFDRFAKLKSRMKFDESIATKLDLVQDKIPISKALKYSPEEANRMKEVFADKNSPILSNIVKRIGRGKLPAKSAPGAPSTKLPALVGTGAGVLAGDYVTSTINAIKNSSIIPAVKNNKYMKKIIDKLHSVMIRKPIKQGYANPDKDFVHGFKNRAMEFGWNPTSQTLKHTASKVANNLEESSIDSKKVKDTLGKIKG